MKIKDAVNRIYWRFGGNGNKKPFPVNENDVEAYNSIKNYVAEKEQQQFQNHEMFAKVFIYLYMKVLQNDNGTILDETDQFGKQKPNVSRRKIYNLLRKDLSAIVQEFTDMLNESDQYRLMEAVQGEIMHPAFVTDEQRKENAQKLKVAIEVPENKARLLGEVWDYEFVKQALESEVNQALELFGK